MRKLKLSFSQNALNQIYFSYILSVLEYASILFGTAVQSTIPIIRDKIQTEAAHIVTGLTLRTDCTRHVAGLRLLKEEEDSKKNKLLFNNAHHDLLPTDSPDLIQPRSYATISKYGQLLSPVCTY